MILANIQIFLLAISINTDIRNTHQHTESAKNREKKIRTIDADIRKKNHLPLQCSCLLQADQRSANGILSFLAYEMVAHTDPVRQADHRRHANEPSVCELVLSSIGRSVGSCASRTCTDIIYLLAATNTCVVR